ncbi:MAG TPA: hypothetical protein VFF78_02060 [Anaerolineaceae bacterium]|nr:hypothetical protein [Anaerolineaceae bacterium]
MNDSPLLDWLLHGDPAIRWQVMRDLQDTPPEQVHAEREKVAQEGWGAQILARQNPDGRWAKGLYSPKWTSTTYTLLLLRSLGLPPGHPAALRGLDHLLEAANPAYPGMCIWRSIKHSDICVDAMILSMLVYFQHPTPQVEKLQEHLLNHQIADFGWNCEDHRGISHSSFHTTISVLEAFLECQANGRALPGLEQAAAAGREFLLEHHLFRSHRTGEVFDERMLRFSFPARWYYDVLRALDHFQAVNAPYDLRMQDALDLLNKKRLSNGRWKLENRHPGLVFFELEAIGEPSRWNTLRALRVLQAYPR